MMRVEAHPTAGAERFVNLEVLVTDTPAPFSARRDLDRAGRKRLATHLGKRHIQAILARVQAHWRSDSNRLACMEFQRSRRGRREDRWADVEAFAADIRAGALPPGGMVYVESGGLLLPIDGTRRLMASLESGYTTMDAIVLRPA